MSPSVYTDNKGRDILVLKERPIQGLNDSTFTAEAKYPIDFTHSSKTFV